MHQLMSVIGRSHLRVLLAGIVTLALGLGAAPNLNGTHAVGTATLFAVIAMVLRACSAYVPSLSVAHYIGKPIGDWVDAFLRGGIGAFIVLVSGWLDAPDLSTWRSAWSAIIVGALAAGAHALQDILTKGQLPGSTFGIAPPPVSPLPPAPVA